MFDSHEYQTVVLGALLHDIGKFLQRGSFGPLDISGRHPKVSADFISAFADYFRNVSDVDLLKTLVQRHHENRNAFPPELLVQSIADAHTRTLASLVSLADNLSSSERGQRLEQWQDFKFTPLTALLHRVNAPTTESSARGQSASLSYRAMPLASPGDGAMNALFPEQFASYAAGELNSLLTTFGPELHRCLASGPLDHFDVLLSRLLSLLQKYTWCVPSNTQESYPDVSLFDHLRGTAAIASCLYRYHVAADSLYEEAVRHTASPRFCLVVGDLSGIQRYIFGIAAIGEGGVARRLRARSLYVQLLTEVAANKILRAAHLPQVHLVMASGGKFYVLGPNTAEMQAAVEQTRREVAEALVSEFNGEITLNLEQIVFADDGFKATSGGLTGFGRVVRDVNAKLARHKLQPLSSWLLDSAWRPERFVIPLHYQGEEACGSCRKFPREAEGVCKHCLRDRDLGARLPRSRYVIFSERPDAGDISILGHSVSVLASLSDLPDSPYLILKLNDTRLDAAVNCPSQFRFLATHVPFDRDDRLLTFADIASRSQGRTLLAFLKADVDRLGETFATGLRRPEADLDTISRTATLSRQLDWFFSGWIEHLCRTEFSDCYTVYAGGDDLFIVGPWSQVLALAERIAVDFARYTANPTLTISAGVVISRHDFPIATAAAQVDEALKRAKAAGRDRIAVLGDCLTWSDWRKVSGQWRAFLDSGELSRVSSAFLYSLLEYAAMWRSYVQNHREKGGVLGLRFQPLLAYNIARNLDRRQTPALVAWADSLVRLRPLDSEQRWLLDHLGLLAQLMILSSRGEASDDIAAV